MISKNHQSGLSLIEIVLLISLLFLVGAALTQLAVVSVKTADAARVRSTANELAREATELARAQRDSNAATFFALTTGYYSLGGGTFTLRGGACAAPCPDFEVLGVNPAFYREVYIGPDPADPGNPDKKVVTVKVYYPQRGLYQNVVLQTVLSNWR